MLSILFHSASNPGWNSVISFSFVSVFSSSWNTHTLIYFQALPPDSIVGSISPVNTVPISDYRLLKIVQLDRCIVQKLLRQGKLTQFVANLFFFLLLFNWAWSICSRCTTARRLIVLPFFRRSHFRQKSVLLVRDTHETPGSERWNCVGKNHGR